MDAKSTLGVAVRELADLLPALDALGEDLNRLAEALRECWLQRGKVLIAGNGGSAADAMHFAEELVVRFRANRRALAAIALCDPTILTCAGNDFGFERVFERQVEALGRPEDLLIVMSTSGDSENLVRAVALAKQLKLRTAAFLGRDGGRLRDQCDIQLIVPCSSTARIQEAHKLLFHCLCEWADMETKTPDGRIAPPRPVSRRI